MNEYLTLPPTIKSQIHGSHSHISIFAEFTEMFEK